SALLSVRRSQRCREGLDLRRQCVDPILGLVQTPERREQPLPDLLGQELADLGSLGLHQVSPSRFFAAFFAAVSCTCWADDHVSQRAGGVTPRHKSSRPLPVVGFVKASIHSSKAAVTCWGSGGGNSSRPDSGSVSVCRAFGPGGVGGLGGSSSSRSWVMTSLAAVTFRTAGTNARLLLIFRTVFHTS